VRDLIDLLATLVAFDPGYQLARINRKKLTLLDDLAFVGFKDTIRVVFFVAGWIPDCPPFVRGVVDVNADRRPVPDNLGG